MVGIQNTLIKMIDDIELGPVPMPQQKLWSTHEIILLTAIILLLIYVLFLPEKTTITYKTNSGDMVKNNIQASHILDDKRKLCATVDDCSVLQGNSMQPTFFEGNTILLKSYNESIKILAGDIVRYFTEECNDSNKSMETVHRVNAVYSDYIVVIGDNTNVYENIKPCQITDIVVGVLYT